MLYLYGIILIYSIICYNYTAYYKIINEKIKVLYRTASFRSLNYFIFLSTEFGPSSHLGKVVIKVTRIP